VKFDEPVNYDNLGQVFHDKNNRFFALEEEKHEEE